MSASPTSEETHAEVRLELDFADDADAASIDGAARRLRRELLELEVERVELAPAGEPPPGSRAGETIALGSIIVALARNTAALASVVRAVQSWAARDRHRTVRIELDGDTLEVAGISSREQERLISAWLARHGNG
jgi:hypothetical protein